MTEFHLSKRSLSRLRGVHPQLAKVVKMAIEFTSVDFAVLEGVRTIAKQREYVDRGVSWTMRSRHLTGHAVDLGAYDKGKIVWAWPLYFDIADAMDAAADFYKVKIQWGGDWKGKKADGPHFQLKTRLKFPSDERNEKNARILAEVS